MKKTSLIITLFILFFTLSNSFAQSPKINYPAVSNITAGKAIMPLKPVHSGGAVPNLLFSEVKTVAGYGAFGQKDTIAAKATFRYVLNTAQDSKGNIYVADAGSNAIRKINARGMVTTFAGSIKGEKGNLSAKDTAARFDFPTGIAVDKNDNVYVADISNNIIRKITPNGDVKTFAGNINPGYLDAKGTSAKFAAPYGICFDANGDLLVADTYNNRIRRIKPDGTVSTVAGSGLAGTNSSFNDDGPVLSARFATPRGIVADKLGNIYVTESDEWYVGGAPTGFFYNAIRKINTNTGMVSTFARLPLDGPIGIAVDAQNNVYASNMRKYNIYRFRPDGTRSDPFGAFSGGDLSRTSNGTDTLTKYKGNMGLSYNGMDHVIIADAFAGLIRKAAVNGYQVFPRLPDGLSLDSTGTITGTPAKISNAARYTIYAYNNFGVDSTFITLRVQRGTQTITFDPLPAKIYGDADFSPGASSTNSTIPVTYVSNNSSVATIVNGKIHIVGVGSAIITAMQSGNENYAAALGIRQELQVNKAPLLITADNKIKTVNKENPVLTLTYSGFVNGESVSKLSAMPLLETDVVTTTVVGKYAINVSGAAAANYEISYKNGIFTVFPVPEIVATGSTTIIKGGSVLLSAVPGANYTYQWYFNGSDISGANSSTYSATQTGAYTVSITDNGYTTTSLYVPVVAQLQLPPDNFTVKANSVTCKGTNNGSITITAKNQMKYSAVVTGNGNSALYNFTDQLTLNNLPPGSFTICFSVQDEIFNQCFQVFITEPQDLSLYSVVNKAQSTVTLQLSGASNYNIHLNDVAYTTSSTQITLPLSGGINKLSVATDLACQGIIEKEIDMGIVQPFPNPFVSSVKVNVGSKVIGNVRVNITDLRNGKTVFQNTYRDAGGILEIDLSALESGIYYLNLNLDNRESGYKIIKK